jgi:hypothetical protein
MDSAVSTSPSIRNKKEKQIPSDVETSTNTKSVISDNQTSTKNLNQDKMIVPEEKKQYISDNSNISNIGVINSPPVNSKNLMRKQTAIKKGKKKRVTFNKNYLDIVNVESYKRFNVDVSINGQEQNEIVRCRCSIF